jgi:exodeoxyribonuclease V alpha subunit
MLTKIFRQDAASDIVQNAHRINNGTMPVLDNNSKDFFFLERNDADVICKKLVELITKQLPPYVNADPMEIQVLTPMRKGALGVRELNGVLQRHLNPPNSSKREYQSGDTLYREGDKVMQIKNNYNLEWEIVGAHNIVIDRGMGIYNGDSGLVREINERGGYMVVEYDEQRRVTYSLAQLTEIEPAFAITIHKAQGSEYPAVVIPLLSGPRLLFNRNLLYTWVTRARRLVVLLGQRPIIAEMVANVSPATRNTSLHERINEIKCS